MNKHISLHSMAVASACFVALAMGIQTASAAPAASRSRASTESLRVTSAAPQSGGINRVSLGLTTIPAYPLAAQAGISGLIDIGNGNSIQAIFSIGFPGSFAFGTGGIFRHDIKTSGDSGFHVGGGLALGVGQATIAGFGVGGGYNFGLIGMGVGGFHVAVPGTSGNLVAHFDAALGVGFTAGSTTAFYTNLSSASSALGISLHYAI